MAIKDTPQGYSWLSILLHWVAGVTVIVLWFLPEIAEESSKEVGRELMGYHISIAMTLYIVLWFRIFWRLGNKRPALVPQNTALDFLAKWVPMVLLAGIAIMLISGPLMVWSNGYDISVFNVVTLPSPMEKSESLHELLESVHEFGGQVIFFGVILHVLGVLKHLIINKDGTLKKILVPNNR